MLNQIQYIKSNLINPNPNNPRIVKDYKYKSLVKSIKDFPDMLSIRPIVVNKDMFVLGGNMRLRACIEAGIKEIPVIIADKLTEKEQREFTIKDNTQAGEWDWEMVANEWDNDTLIEWGMDVWKTPEINLDEFFEASNDSKLNDKKKIILEYSDEEYLIVKDELLKYGKTYEDAVYNLLKL